MHAGRLVIAQALNLAHDTTNSLRVRRRPCLAPRGAIGELSEFAQLSVGEILSHHVISGSKMVESINSGGLGSKS